MIIEPSAIIGILRKYEQPWDAAEELTRIFEAALRPERDSLIVEREQFRHRESVWESAAHENRLRADDLQAKYDAASQDLLTLQQSIKKTVEIQLLRHAQQDTVNKRAELDSRISEIARELAAAENRVAGGHPESLPQASSTPPAKRTAHAPFHRKTSGA